jgi:hypothetical protein
MSYNYYKTVYIQNTFEAGVAVGSLRSHLAHQGAGEANYKQTGDGYIEVEIATYNPLVMSYAEDKLADFV